MVLKTPDAQVLEQGEHWRGRVVVSEEVDRLCGRRCEQGVGSPQQVARLVEADETRRLGRPRALAPSRLGTPGAAHDHLVGHARLEDGQLAEHGLAARAEQPLPTPRRMRARNRRDQRTRVRRVGVQGSPLDHPRRVRAPKLVNQCARQLGLIRRIGGKVALPELRRDADGGGRRCGGALGDRARRRPGRTHESGREQRHRERREKGLYGEEDGCTDDRRRRVSRRRPGRVVRGVGALQGVRDGALQGVQRVQRVRIVQPTRRGRRGRARRRSGAPGAYDDASRRGDEWSARKALGEGEDGRKVFQSHNLP